MGRWWDIKEQAPFLTPYRNPLGPIFEANHCHSISRGFPFSPLKCTSSRLWVGYIMMPQQPFEISAGQCGYPTSVSFGLGTTKQV
jgi:hypothetical protein